MTNRLPTTILRRPDHEKKKWTDLQLFLAVGLEVLALSMKRGLQPFDSGPEEGEGSRRVTMHQRESTHHGEWERV